MDAGVEELQARCHANWKALEESVVASLGLAPKSTTLNDNGAANAGRLKNMIMATSGNKRRNEFA